MPSDRNDDVVLRLRQIAFTEAWRIDLSEDDAHDCAMTMVLHALIQVNRIMAATVVNSVSDAVEEDPISLSATSVSIVATHLILRDDLRPDQTISWLRRCARNFALNYRRHIDARRRREVVPDNSSQSGNAEDKSIPAELVAPPAEYDALNHLLHKDVFAAMHELPPHAREVFARFHLDGDSLAEIAFSAGKSPDAVKKQLHRTRHHVRVALTKLGHAPNKAGKEAAKTILTILAFFCFWASPDLIEMCL